jgi:hypothetical protein
MQRSGLREKNIRKRALFQMGGSNKAGKEKFYTSEMSNLGDIWLKS